MSIYSVNLLDRPGHCIRLDEGELDYEAARDLARSESRRTTLPVEVWREGAYGPTAERRYVNGEEVRL